MALRWIGACVIALCGLTAWATPQTIKPGDRLQIICAEEASINRDYKVTADGLVLVDFLGAVKVAGLTETQASDLIAKNLVTEKIVKKATVSVKIIGLEPKMVKFGGAVGLGAETMWRDGLRLSDIIRLAEVKPETDLARIQIKSTDGQVALVDATEPAKPGSNPLLKPGDEITFFMKGTQPTNPTPINPPVQTGKVTLNGKVNLPGTYDFVPSMTLRDLLVRAGGLLSSADTSSITLDRAGAKRTLRIPADNELALQGGDNITIAELPKPKMSVSIDGSVRRPGRYEIEEGTTLTQVIKMAGGFVNGAKSDRIKIFSTDNVRPREVNYEDIELGYRGDIILKSGQSIEIAGPRGGNNLLALGPKERVAAGALAIFLLLGL